MRQHIIKTSYFFSLAFLLTSILFFFASNWGYFGRYEKISFSIFLIVLFYGLSFLVSKLLSHHAFLSKWLMLSELISFGISVALLGQIYNSHADSYVLFLVWLVPAMLLAVITKYVPFWFISFILFHVTIWLFFFPVNGLQDYDVQQLFFILLSFALIDLSLFFICQKVSFKWLTRVSMVLFQLFLVVLTIYPRYVGSGTATHWPFTLIASVLLIGTVSYFIFKYRTSDEGKDTFIISILSFSIFFLWNSLEFVFQVAAELAFLYSFFLFAVVTVASILGLRTFQKKAVWKNGETKKWVMRILVGIATFLGTSFLLASLSFFIMATVTDFSEVVILIFSVGLLILGTYLNEKWMTLKYSISIAGFIYLLIYCVIQDHFVSYIFASVIALIITYIERKRGFIHVTYFTFNGFFILLLSNMLTVQSDTMLTIVALAVILLQGVIYLVKKTELKFDAYCYVLISLLALTFQEKSISLLIFFTLLYVLVTVVIFYKSRKATLYQYVAGFLFVIFIVEKYYEYLWRLLHKSLSFFLIGIVFFIIALTLERGLVKIKQSGWSMNIWRKTLIVLVFQLLFTSYVVYSKEMFLRKGETISLQLEPIDPRSLLQGDYVIIDYTIAHALDTVNDGMKGDIRLVLQPDEDGVYKYAGTYRYRGNWNRPYNPQAEDVIINGVIKYGYISFGIENYFVEENTGLELQRNAKYAKVIVGANGDAILDELLTQ